MESPRMPVQLHNAVPGFVDNRLQSALLREAIRRVSDGVVDTKGLDDIVLNSIGVRLASVGPMLAFQFGSQGGAREMIEKSLPACLPLRACRR